MNRLRILVANFFPAFHPPSSGGEQRYHYLYRHLSRHCDVTLLSPTYSHHAFEEVRFSPSFVEMRVPKHRAFDRLHWELYARGIGPECSAYVVALASALESEYSNRFSAAAFDADVIIHESPFTLPYDRSFGTDGKPRIYNAYNVEHRLARQILLGDVGAKASEFVRFLERTLARNAALIFATSDEDRVHLASDFDIHPDRIALAPNGFEPVEDAPPQSVERHESRVVFVGSAHPPNVEAARFIGAHLAQALPSVEFRIMGTVCDKLRERDMSGNVRLLGFVDEAVKRQELESCTAAINPMFAGSGTNLKVLEYLGAGAPVVTTVVGARGFALTDGVDAFIAGSDEFADRLQRVLSDATLRVRVGNAGKEKALSQFTWRLIADRANAAIRAMVDTPDSATDAAQRRPLLLHVNDFPVANAEGGGEVRIRELLTELGRSFDVILLCLTQETMRSERWLAAHVRELRIPKTTAHRDAEVLAACGEAVSINDLLAAEFCGANRDLVAAFRGIAATAVAVVFEHPYLFPLAQFLEAGQRIVYSSFNVERRLKLEMLQSRRDAAPRIEQARELEHGMMERANLVVCVSEQDRRAFVQDFGETSCIVVENGVRTATRETRREHLNRMRPRASRALGIFLGSAHPPNTEAARFLIEVVAPAIPELDIVIVGSVCSTLGAMRAPANVHRVGVVSEAEKNSLLDRADVALNPLFHGGGSSLKVPDFFASGLAMISTPTGARGYPLRDGEHYVEAERASFVAKTRFLLGDPRLRERIGTNARRYAEQALDWSALGRRYRDAIGELIGHAPKPRVLVVTYRFADPPPGGAETFLVKILQELWRRGGVSVDVATCDIDTIANKWHFSAEYGRSAVRKPAPEYVDSFFAFAADPPATADFGACTRLFHLWMKETREQAVTLLEGDRNILLGGWNFPERRDGKTRRWTSGESQLQVARATSAVRIRGYAPRPVVVDIGRDGKSIASRTLSGRFEWEAEVGDGSPVIALNAKRTYAAHGDPRELGFVVDAIEFRDATGWNAIALDEDFETAARGASSVRWVRSLVEITGRRKRSDDRLFYDVRGPHSADLAHWLERNVGGYDVVLAQGTPFSTPVLATDIASRRGVPVVLLPHFHMEDRYYHWRCYYDMFRRAHCIIAAPETLKSVFFDAIGAPSIAVPGGGIDPEEFADTRLRTASAAFRTLRGNGTPFVLVLGRKTAAKRYQLVVDAVATLNRTGHRVDLVLIGPDEDGVALTEPHTYGYGGQGRDIVLGALRESLCLINMSESESFGIVLLESWLAGRPVIARRSCVAFADLVESGRNGFLVDNASELVDAIGAYLADESIAVQHAREGRAIGERFSWARIAGRIESLLVEASRTASRSKREYSDA